MPLPITSTQGFVVFLAFCYFACLFLVFFVLYLIFESWQRNGSDDQEEIEEGIRVGPFSQKNWLPKSMEYVTSDFYYEQNEKKYYYEQWVIWY